MAGAVTFLSLAACGGGGGGGADDDTAAIPTSTEGAGAATVNVAIGETGKRMYMRLSQPSVAAGSVTFIITNEGIMEHEFIVLGTDKEAGDLAVEGRFAEEPNVIDEAEGIFGGSTVTLTVELEPGHYALICNEPRHYQQEMFADLNVT